MYLVSLSIIVACVTFFDKDSSDYNIKDRKEKLLSIIPYNANIDIRRQKIEFEMRINIEEN